MKKLLGVLLMTAGLSTSLYSVDVYLQPASMSTRIKAGSGGKIVNDKEYLDLEAQDPRLGASYKELLNKSALGLIITVLTNREDQEHYYHANDIKHIGDKQVNAEYFYIPKESAQKLKPYATLLADSTDLNYDAARQYLNTIVEIIKAGQAKVDRKGKATGVKIAKGSQETLRKALWGLAMWHLKETNIIRSNDKARDIFALMSELWSDYYAIQSLYWIGFSYEQEVNQMYDSYQQRLKNADPDIRNYNFDNIMNPLDQAKWYYSQAKVMTPVLSDDSEQFGASREAKSKAATGLENLVQIRNNIFAAIRKARTAPTPTPAPKMEAPQVEFEPEITSSTLPMDLLKKDDYEVLGVQYGATKAEINKAYKERALQWHPDKNPDEPKAAEALFKRLGEAYNNLK